MKRWQKTKNSISIGVVAVVAPLTLYSANIAPYAITALAVSASLPKSALVAKKKKKKKRGKKKKTKQSFTKEDENLVNRRVLVLDFVNQSKVKKFNYLSVSIAEAFLSPLEETEKFDVIDRDAGKSAATKENVKSQNLYKTANAARIGKAANAEVVVMGNFVVIKDTIQMFAKAVDVPSGRVKVTKSVRAKTDQTLFSSIDDLVAKMVKKMEKKLPPLPKREVIREVVRGKVFTISVLDLQANDVNPATAATASDLLRDSLFKTKYFDLIEREKLTQILAEQELGQSGAISNADAVKVGQLLGAEKVIIGSIAAVDEDYQLSARMINVKTSKVEASDSRIAQGKAGLQAATDRVASTFKEQIGGEVAEKPKPKNKPKKKGAEPGDDTPLGLSVWFSGGYEMPLATFKNILEPGLYLELGTAYVLMRLGPIEIAALLAVGGSLHNGKSSLPAESKSRSLIGWAGGDASYLAPFLRPLTLHLALRGGLKHTVASRRDRAELTSDDWVFAVNLGAEYTVFRSLSVLLYGSYVYAFLVDGSITHVQAMLGVGHKL